MLIPRSIATSGAIRRRTLSQKVRFGTMSLTLVMFFLALSVTLMYLVHANRVATRGYAIKKLEAEKQAMVTDYEIWQQRVSDAKSLTALKGAPEMKTLVAVGGKATYLQGTENIAQK